MIFIASVLLYLGLLTAAVVLCFTTSQSKRGKIRVATALFSIPLWLAIAFCIVMWLWLGKQPPTLPELQRNFPLKKADLETILRMSNEDANFSRIAPDFLDRDSESGDQPSGSHPIAGRYMKGDSKAGLSEDRWNAYRWIYSRNRIKLGIQRDSSHDAFIMVDSIGLLNRGHTTGYLYCAQPYTVDVSRFEPCTLNRDKGVHKYDPNTREEGYSFQRIEGDWYAFDEGPS